MAQDVDGAYELVEDAHPRAKAGIEPYAIAMNNHVMILKGDGAFNAAEIQYHDLFDHEWLAYWINEGLDKKYGKNKNYWDK